MSQPPNSSCQTRRPNQPSRRALALAGLNLLLLWLLRPTIATVVANNLGSVRLNRVLLAADLPPNRRAAAAVVAGQSFQSALAWDPLNDQAYYNLGTLYDSWGDTDAAARAWSRAAALDPDDPSAHFALGLALDAQGYGEQALAEWDTAGAAHYLLRQGLAQARAGDPSGALQQYRRALSIAPDLVDAHYLAGRALIDLGRLDEALQALETAAALEPASSPRAYHLQAEVYSVRQEWTAALAAYHRAADVSPQDPVPHFRMGQILSTRLDDPAAALAEFEAALERNPDYTPARLALAELYSRDGDCDAAAEWLTPLLASPHATAPLNEPELWTAHRQIGGCLLDQGRPEVALSHLEQAAALRPDAVPAQLQLAAAYTLAGRYRQAIDTYLRVLELDPGNTAAARALQELDWTDTDALP